MFYTANLEVYFGQQPEERFQVSNRPSDVVQRLCEPIYDSGRNLTIDNWFTSIELVNKLYEKKITVVRTIRKNKRELPFEFTKPKHPINSSMFGFNQHITLVSYIPKKNKNVSLVSSLHHDDAIDYSSGNQNKPEIIALYNSTKIGVDMVNQLSANYNKLFKKHKALANGYILYHIEYIWH
ncbi:uncharacterized protein [Diabrotica undecimpunctata]|uniref:uncharacterized protein n=1 Tax=Diabrotica undecimpunctata TaxID=50387 RepID=UPI003B640F0E